MQKKQLHIKKITQKKPKKTSLLLIVQVESADKHLKDLGNIKLKDNKR